MTHDELREAVARVLCPGCGGHANDCCPDNCVAYREAEAALRVVRNAMREPDEAMVDAAYVEGTKLGVVFRYSEAARMLRLSIAASPLADPAARDDGMEGA